MDMLIYAMVYAGSALMVYNIMRCYGFVARMRNDRSWDKPRVILYVPLVLLVMFLIGYLVVGLFGEPDAVIASILFGGSVFVFVVLGILYNVIDNLKKAQSMSQALYEEAREDLDSIIQDYATALRVNLTKNKVEEVVGSSIDPLEFQGYSYDKFLSYRRRVILPSDAGVDNPKLITRENLLREFEAGNTRVEGIALCNLEEEGYTGFVRVQATMGLHPTTNDVVAFLIEEFCNDELLDNVIRTKALTGQFDMITYLIDGHYHVLIGDDSAHKRGSIFPKHKSGTYLNYLEEQVVPVICGTQDEKEELLRALSPERVDEALGVAEPYEVNIACDLAGEVFYKRFVFYVVDRTAKFYLLLKSDTTDARREEIERNDRLREALAEAQRASQAKTTFLSNMSHDIRTPMNAIVGYTDFARRSDDDAEIHRYLDKIDSSSQYLLALINDVLEMSRIESGKLDLSSDETNLIDVMDDLRNMFDTQMRDKGLVFTVDASQVVDRNVLCDPVRLNRVLLNLLSNAYKFTPTGGSVSVRLTQVGEVVDGRATYELRVRDTGIGMSQEFAAKVFEAFERERNTTASGIQGTGLGMAISKRIVDAMGGSIDVFSKEGEGTEFVVRVVLETCAVPEEHLADGLAAGPEEIDFEGMRILLVEDNEINREIACMLLEELGFVMEEAVDGQQAVDKLVAAGAGHFDVVITDIQMPVMNGYEEAKAIRALDDPELANIPIIAMSANAFKEDIDAAMAVGMNGYVSKPVDVGKVIDELTRVFAERRR
jgi:signal transduction histidine kinase/ActR/RegA family two-component response regulator